MTRQSLNLTDDVYDYLLKVSLREHEVLRRLRARNEQHPLANLQIAPDQGQFMAFLVKMLNARRIIELGVFMGYSSLWMALALPDDGKLIACDINREWAGIAREFWREAGVSHKIELRLAPALKTLDALLADGQAGTFDFVFLDAEKTEYRDYYERSLALLRPGGVIAVDNTLWSGRVLDPNDNEPDTAAIREFNARLAKDERVDLSMLPVGDGLTLARKR